MDRLTLTAGAFCLLISVAQPQGFTILTENRRINVTEGGNAFFSLKPSAAVMFVSWAFKNTDVVLWVQATIYFVNNYGERAEFFLPNGSLLLKSVRVSDSGDYSVKMLNEVGSDASATLTLHVLAQPQGFTILTENRRINVTEGGNAFFSLKPSAAARSGSWAFKNTDVVVWIRATIDFKNNYGERAEFFLPNGSLLLKSVRVSDSGDYSVKMLNEVGSDASATLTLHVLAQPQGFTILTENRRINVTEGGNAFFSLKPSAAARSGSWAFKNTDVVVWIGATIDFKNNYGERAEFFPPNGSLLLKSVRVSDSGDYSVKMLNEVGSDASATLTLHVLAQPQVFTILTENTRIIVTEGGNAVFTVKPSGTVKNGSWEFRNTVIAQWSGAAFSLNIDYRERTELFLPNGSLLLKSVRVSDSGDYTVKMTPDVGSETPATLTLHVLDSPTEIPKLSLGAIIGMAIAAFILGLIIGISAWLIKRRACRLKDSSQGQYATNSNANRIAVSKSENSATTYENIPRKEKEQSTKPLEENSTYMGLDLQDRSVYSELRGMNLIDASQGTVGL
ncbi:pregnancy-specific glycoprotein 22-like isoform X2 [Scyliorhinus torazame]|uniref:pregnancy-specific glycoprotein 22-like isoform X2 n=1 Tax=Scyliorhinus torazame TaxID=75743 RepID=UPI003B59D8B9